MSVVAKTAALLRPRASSVKIGPIGIDFALEAIHLVQLEATAGKPPEVRARASLPFDGSRRKLLENPHQFRTLIKRALKADRFYGRKAVIAIPPGMFRTISINYRSGPGRDQESAAILKVMKDRLDGDLADYVLDYLPVKSRSKNDERLALVAVSERQPIVDFLELARKARLDVQALEIGPVAISRVVSELALESGSDNVLVINSGRNASFLTVISGTDLLFDQEVAFGENSLIRQAAETLDMSEDMARDLILRAGVRSGNPGDAVEATIAEAGLVNTISEILKPQFLKLVEEIKRVCLYAAAETRGGVVGQVYLLGSIARWPGTADLLSTLTGTSVAKIPDPLALFPSSPDKSPAAGTAAPEIVVATGAALRGMQIHG
ncbi:MAG: pilus assembly protein PilM [Gammaproteobacteria bacterium]|nr:pilus assembly protein PilM [Gammaproteobacteria bacterium]MDH3751601.1 pilus assembly protein PilM [Gammaproteobacteria bacterium]MDH3804446.1 pilus assembly protein PilM [Gammaproteobacteria bacterium]